MRIGEIIEIGEIEPALVPAPEGPEDAPEDVPAPVETPEDEPAPALHAATAA